MDKSESFILSVAGVLLLLIVFKTYIRNERLANSEYKKGFPRCVRLLDTLISVVCPPLVSVLYLLSSALHLKSLLMCIKSNMLSMIIAYGASQFAYNIIYQVFSYDRSYTSGNYQYIDSTRESIEFRKWFVDIAWHLGSLLATLLIFAVSVKWFGKETTYYR